MLRAGLIALTLTIGASVGLCDEAAKGEYLYVEQVGGAPDIWLTKGEDAPRNLTANAAADVFPAWSPDGKRIAFCSARDTGTFNVYVMNADGDDVEKVTDLARGADGQCFCPSWSPDGTTIAYQLRKGDTSHLYTIELEGGRVRHLTDNAWDPAWSPGGDKIVFTGLAEKGWSLSTIEPDGGKHKEIVATDNKVGFVYPAWSPDGKRIAFTAPVDGAFDIRVCDASGENLKQLTKVGGMNTHVSWWIDGSRAYYYHQVDEHNWRWDVVDVATGKSEPLKPIRLAPYLHGARIAWRPK
jgi:TolB protein